MSCKIPSLNSLVEENSVCVIIDDDPFPNTYKPFHVSDSALNLILLSFVPKDCKLPLTIRYESFLKIKFVPCSNLRLPEIINGWEMIHVPGFIVMLSFICVMNGYFSRLLILSRGLYVFAINEYPFKACFSIPLTLVLTWICSSCKFLKGVLKTFVSIEFIEAGSTLLFVIISLDLSEMDSRFIGIGSKLDIQTSPLS